MYQEDVKDTLRSQLEISRERAISLGEEAVRIIRNGYYDLPDGRRVDIRDDLDRSIKGTQVYRQHVDSETYAGGKETIIKVQNQTTLAAVQELIAVGEKPVALNFSSPSEPGGGFLRGSRAQEEYLARSSGIWACLNECPVYFHSKTDLEDLQTTLHLFTGCGCV
ncbi:MAG: TIGR02452 family protein [Anaerolineaceae bacterium]|nr:TIGR02452 family protein [Anaerolineaceae bacterium]